MEQRADPEARPAQAEERMRGRLKIFLGYAAGVGKTFAMLEAAHQRQNEGVDVVVGYVESHKLAETQGMLEGMEIIPRVSVEDRDICLTELDLDAVLRRHPALVLVDEMAHVNAPGSLHARRYQDIEEILDEGIDVYTTLNIQDLESLSDAAAQVTGVIVRETVPDRVIEKASGIEVIDLPPEELLVRLKEGKVYVRDHAVRAIQEFLGSGNPAALREMPLRAAEHVDHQMRSCMGTRAIPNIRPASERLLVCISPGPYAEKIVRAARRLADELNADWFAVYVELATRPELNPANRSRIDETLRLAESLGAKARTITGRTIPEAVFAYARKHNITKIVVGKPVRPRWTQWLGRAVVDQLIYASGDIDVYMISEKPDAVRPVVPAEWRPHKPLMRYLMGLGLVALATGISMVFRGWVDPTNLVMVYLLAVVAAAAYLGRGPSLLAAFTGVIAFDVFLIPPYYPLTLAVNDTQYVFTFAVLLTVSLVISTLTARVREQAEAAVQHEARANALYSLGRDLTSAMDLEQVADIIIGHIGEVFGHKVAIFLPHGAEVEIFAHSADYIPDENELAVANWVFQHEQPSSPGSDIPPAPSLRCQPLKTGRGVVGVLGVRPPEEGSILSLEQRESLIAFANHAALSIERAVLAEQAKQAELLSAADKLQTALLNSISHDLRTPLVSITGALTTLEEDDYGLDVSSQHGLIHTAREEADRLNRLVGNLLDMTRLEAGALKVKRDECDVEDLIGTAIGQMEGRLVGRVIDVSVAQNTPPISVDFVLIVHVLNNLLDNALKYSPEGSALEVSAQLVGKDVQIAVMDHGIGIPKDDLEKVFDKFYRVQRPEHVTGTGLGLAICKGIVEAHGGRVYAAQRSEGGTCILVAIPAFEES